MRNKRLWNRRATIFRSMNDYARKSVSDYRPRVAVPFKNLPYTARGLEQGHSARSRIFATKRNNQGQDKRPPPRLVDLRLGTNKNAPAYSMRSGPGLLYALRGTLAASVGRFAVREYRDSHKCIKRRVGPANGLYGGFAFWHLPCPAGRGRKIAAWRP